MARDTDTSHKENVSDGQSADARENRGRRWRALRERSDFLRVRAAGLRRVMPGFILQAAPNNVHTAAGSGRSIQIGFTASKKVGNAVARNRAKRRLRALADTIMSDSANPHFDYVLIGRTETLRRDFSSMENDLRRALKRICKTSDNNKQPTAPVRNQ